jgi:hypothetical protein
MFYIIEKKEQLENIYLRDEIFMNIIPINDNYHPYLHDISLIYVREVENHKGYILCINHSESFSLELTDVLDRLGEVKKIYVLDKKTVLYSFPTLNNQIIDITLYNNLINNTSIEVEKYESKIESDFRRKFRLDKYSTLIPISKHYEKWENIYDNIEENIKSYKYTQEFDLLNNYAIPLFFNIEKNGISINKEKFIEHFSHISNPEFSIYKGRIYTQYNLNTLTNRPSNSFNKINFAALKKANNERALIIPENDKLIEIDFKAYHPSIIAELCNYGYDKNINIYEYLSSIISDVSLDNIKTSLFQQIYGGIKDEFKDKPFFNQVHKYTEKIWVDSINGVKGHELGKIFYRCDIQNPNPQKVLNYIIQNTETVFNIIMFTNIINVLKDKKSKIILYTYDSILIDYKEDDNVFNDIKKWLKFKYSIKEGKNYAEMKEVKYL